MNVAVIYHAGCPDGHTAAWVARNALGPDTTLIPATHGHPPPGLDGLDLVYIVDYSYPHDVLVDMARDRQVVVLDHHRTAIDDICTAHGDQPDASQASYEGAYKAVLDIDRSGAGITWDYFRPGEARPVVVDYVQDRDLWRWALPHSREVNAFLRTQTASPDDLDGIPPLTVEEMAAAGAAMMVGVQAYAAAAASQAYWCEMGRRYFPIVNITYEHCSDVAVHMLDLFEVDMVGYFFHRSDGHWQYGFRSRNGVRVDDLAAQFGGGGHREAAGCQPTEISHRRVNRDVAEGAT